MKKEDLKILETINPDKAKIIINEIRDKYELNGIGKLAHNITTGFYFLGFAIFITLFQSMAVLSYEASRNYRKAMLWSLLSFNPFFFLYLGQQRRWKKFYDQELEKITLPLGFEELKAGNERVTNLTNIDIDKIRNLKITNIPAMEKHEVLGIIYGSAVRSKNAFRDIGASVKSVGGEKINSYVSLMNETREDAIKTLIRNTVREFKEFDEISNIRFTSVTISAGLSEIMVYGTVIKYKK